VSDHERRRKQVREANRRMRARRKRGQYRRTITVPGGQFRRLAELGYLKRVDNPAAQVTASEAFLYDELQASS
jgi:hypothetical protein